MIKSVFYKNDYVQYNTEAGVLVATFSTFNNSTYPPLYNSEIKRLLL